MPQLRRRVGEGKAPSRSFRKKKKTEAMSPTLVQHFRYSRCDPPHERFAVDVPFAFATSCFRQGHRRYAPRTWRREMHRDCWRTRGTSARLRLRIQLTEDSSSIIPHSSPAGNQKPCFKTLGGERQPGPSQSYGFRQGGTPRTERGSDFFRISLETQRWSG